MADSCDATRVAAQIDPHRVLGLQSLLDPHAAPLQRGQPLPPLWHWVALARWPDSGRTGSDGHPLRPMSLRDTPVRRMFAGGEVTFARVPLRVGDHVVVATEVGEVVQKSGRSGDFVLATFATTVSDTAGEVLMTERQDVVYTEPRASALQAPEGVLPLVGHPLRTRVDGGAELATDPAVLLRFSALTANAHRIHYDLAYARTAEQLPGLLVHGPLINLALTQMAAAGRSVSRIEHRNLSPLFVGQTAALTAVPSGPGEMTAQATSPDGRTTSRVVIKFSDVEEQV